MLPDDLDLYSLDVMLSRSTALRDLGRLVWEAKEGDAGQQDGNRLDIVLTIEAVLNRAGKPLEYSRLLKEVAKHRGVGQKFQIHPSGDVIRLDLGKWGLRSRDVKLSDSQIATGLSTIHSELLRTEQGMRSEEIDTLLARAEVSRVQRLPAAFWLGMAQKDARFRVSMGGLVGLAEWEGVRRLTFASAFRRVVDEFAGQKNHSRM